MIEIPHPAQSLALIGHDHAKSDITEALASGRMHHAWLITGEEGIGKATLAYQIAHMILSNGDNSLSRMNPDHPAARLIMAQAHPDLFVLARGADEKTGRLKDTISVDDARKLGPFLGMTASQGKGRVAIIDEAHRLNRNGQNAILKLIEEPPTGATMLLTATTVGALLPTIRSRCRVLKLDPLTAAQMDIVMARLGADIPASTDKNTLYKAARGSVGRALLLLQTEVLPLYDELLAILRSMPMLDLPRIHKLSERLGRKEEGESYLALTNLMVDALREAVRAVALGTKDAMGLSETLAPQGRLDKALYIWESTAKTFATAESGNLDRKLALINALSEISRSTA